MNERGKLNKAFLKPEFQPIKFLLTISSLQKLLLYPLVNFRKIKSFIEVIQRTVV